MRGDVADLAHDQVDILLGREVIPQVYDLHIHVMALLAVLCLSAQNLRKFIFVFTVFQQIILQKFFLRPLLIVVDLIKIHPVGELIRLTDNNDWDVVLVAKISKKAGPHR